MSFLSLAKQLKETRKVEEKPKKEAEKPKEKAKAKAKPRRGVSADLLKEISTLREEIRELKNVVMNNSVTDQQIRNIVEQVVQSVLSEIREDIIVIIRDATSKAISTIEPTNININVDQIAERIVEKVFGESYILRRLAEKISEIKTKPRIPGKLTVGDLKRVSQLSTLEEQIIYILFIRFGGAQPSELAKFIQDKNIDEIRTTMRTLRREGVLAKRRPSNRYVLNMLNPRVVSTLNKYFDEELVKTRQLEFKELLRKNIVYY